MFIAVERLKELSMAARESGLFSIAIKAQIEINRILGLNYKNIFGEE